MMNNYRLKTTVQAQQVTPENYLDVATWSNSGYFVNNMDNWLVLYVYTRYGLQHAFVGDWIIREPTGYRVIKYEDWELLYEQC